LELTSPGELLRVAKNWGGGGKGASGPEVDLRLLELPALALAGAVGTGDEVIVPAPASPFSHTKPGQTSVRLAHRVAELTGRRCVELVEKSSIGVRVVKARPKRPVIVIEDQVTTGSTLRAVLTALAERRVSVSGVYAWSTSNRNFPPRRRSNGGYVHAGAAKALSVQAAAACFEHQAARGDSALLGRLEQIVI